MCSSQKHVCIVTLFWNTYKVPYEIRCRCELAGVHVCKRCDEGYSSGKEGILQSVYFCFFLSGSSQHTLSQGLEVDSPRSPVLLPWRPEQRFSCTVQPHNHMETGDALCNTSVLVPQKPRRESGLIQLTVEEKSLLSFLHYLGGFESLCDVFHDVSAQ